MLSNRPSTFGKADPSHKRSVCITITIEVSVVSNVLVNSGNVSVPGNLAVENTVVGLLDPFNAWTLLLHLTSLSFIICRRFLSKADISSSRLNTLSIVILRVSREWITSFKISGSLTLFLTSSTSQGCSNISPRVAVDSCRISCGFVTPL